MSPVSILLLLIALQQQPVGGPLTDALERRVTTLTERIDAWRTESEQMQQTRFAEMLQALKDARQDNKTMLEALTELRQQRDGFLSQMRQEWKDYRQENVGFIERTIVAAADKWHPGKHLMWIVWSLVGAVFALCVILVVFASIIYYLYKKVFGGTQ